MSRTLFFYIFKDLLRIFFMTSGALAGIMSFGGLLRPLTEHGLDAGQAAKMLSYFMPAMTTYSLPIAALFATTVVYGRLAADNELVACRAAGISFLSMLMPAAVLGLTVALTSLAFLCFIVPIFTLKVEQVIYSNLGQLIANQIERTHEIKFQDTTIFAQEAAVALVDPESPRDQMVSLGGLMIVSYDKQPSAVPDTPSLQVPREFYLAKRASVFIKRSKSDDYTLEARLEDPGGAMFPRRFTGGQGTQGGVQTTQFGPMVMESLIREQPKFMDIRRLHELYLDLGKSRRVQEQVQKIVRSAQENRYLGQIAQAMVVPNGVFHFNAGREQYDLISPKGAASWRNGKLVITPGRLVQKRADGTADFTWDAAEIELSARPVEDDQISVQASLRNVTAQSAEGATAWTSFARHFTIPMPPKLKTIENQAVDFYQTQLAVPKDEKAMLQREVIKLGNSIQGEMHARASFAVSCLILVVVGCALGMMFKSGNFLTAFALSVVPALICIALIVAGQHTCENVPWKLDNFQNPLNLGIALIWTGNAAVLVLAGILWSRLARE
jgi:lipopolysaccharide export LptBFGC system permease protein LptF